MTIRRDLQELEKQGLLRRVHGGAISKPSLFTGLALSEKEKIRTAEKERIARYAAGLVQRGDVVLIDSGSTTLRLARYLKNQEGLTVVTNSLHVASELAQSRNKVILTGGEMEPDSMALIGPLADQTLSSVAVNKLFMGIDSIDLENGLTTPQFSEARTLRAMMKAASARILLADSSKFGRKCLAVVDKIGALDKIITDSGLDEGLVRKMEQAGVEVIVV